MSAKYDIDHSKDLATFTLTGELSFEEAMEALDAYLKAGLARFEIVDVSSATARKFTFTQLDKIIEWLGKNTVVRPAESKTAFVVPKGTDFETSGLFQVLTQFNRANWSAKVVHSALEAYEWLDIPLDEF